MTLESPLKALHVAPRPGYSVEGPSTKTAPRDPIRAKRALQRAPNDGLV
jgi:hypothetical protein